MALEGSLKEFGLADILQLIYLQKKSGTLTLSGHIDTVRLMFYEGNVVSVESRKRADESRVGRVLVKKGLIKESDLASVLEEQKTSGSRIGDVLLKRGLVGKEEISEILIAQMTETVGQLFSWKEGIYRFEQQTVAVSKDLSIMLDTQHLLIDSLRIIDEWSVVQGKITLDTIFRGTGKTVDSLNPDEEAMLRFIDGENDVSLIIGLSDMDDLQASKALLSLMEKGVIEPAEVLPVTEEVLITPPKVGYAFFAKILPIVVLMTSLILSVIAFTSHKGDSFNSLRTIKDVDGLRFLAEVYKYKNSNYPQHLNQIGNMLDKWGRPYIYKVENENIIIFSAGPDGRAGTEDDVY